MLNNHSALPNIIDIEASGFGANGYPIEIGIALTSGECYCSLIKPTEQWKHWDDSAEKIHHISRDVLLTNGKPVTDVATELNRFLNGITIYSDGWVLDKPWLIQLFHAAGIEQQFRLSPLEMILSEKQIACWDKTKIEVINSLKLQRHRASSDAKIIQQTYMLTHQLTCAQ